MSRIVQARRSAIRPAGAGLFDQAAEPPQPPANEYGERVAKYIPAEVLAAYVAILNLLATMTDPAEATQRRWACAGAFVLGVAGTWLWLRRFPAQAEDLNRHIAVAVVAFIVWAYAFPLGLFAELGWYQPAFAGIALIVFSLASGLIKPATAPTP